MIVTVPEVVLLICSLNAATEYPFAYNSYGATCAEVEIDVLTGQPQILRVDVLYDCGERSVTGQRLLFPHWDTSC